MTAPETSRSNAVPWIVGLVVVAVVAIVAIVASRGSDDDATVKGQTGTVSVGDSTTTADGSTSGSGGVADGEGETTIPTPGTSSALPVYDATTEDAAVGMTIPSITGTDFDGNDLTIGPDGTAKVILFVAHWCPHCQREVPLLKAHLDDSPMPDDVKLLTVSTSVKPGADNYPPQDWLAREGWSAPVLADDELSSAAQAFGLSSFPYFVVVDADGKVVGRTSGEISTDQFDAAVDAARTGTAG